MVNWKNWRSQYVAYTIGDRTCALLIDLYHDLISGDSYHDLSAPTWWVDDGANAANGILFLAAIDINHFNHTHFASAIHTLARIYTITESWEHSINPHVLDIFETAWIGSVAPRLRHFTQSQLIDSICALAELNNDSLDYSAFLTIWMGITIPQLGDFNSEELANSICALAKLNQGNLDCSAFVIAWMGASIPQLAYFDTQDLSNSLWAVASLKHHDVAFETAWMEVATPQLAHFNTQELENTIWALDAFNINNAQVTYLIIKNLCSNVNFFWNKMTNLLSIHALEDTCHLWHKYQIFCETNGQQQYGNCFFDAIAPMIHAANQGEARHLIANLIQNFVHNEHYGELHDLAAALFDQPAIAHIFDDGVWVDNAQLIVSILNDQLHTNIVIQDQDHGGLVLAGNQTLPEAQVLHYVGGCHYY